MPRHLRLSLVYMGLSALTVGTTVVLKKAGPHRLDLGSPINIGDEGAVVNSDPEYGFLVQWKNAGFAAWCGRHDGSALEAARA